MSAEKWCMGDGEDTRRMEEFVYAAQGVRWDEVGAIAAMAAWAQDEATSARGRVATREWAGYRQCLGSGPMKELARQHAATKSVGQWLPNKMVKLAKPYGDWEEEEEARSLHPTRRCTATIVEADGVTAMPASIQQEVDMETAAWGVGGRRRSRSATMASGYGEPPPRHGAGAQGSSSPLQGRSWARVG